MMYQSIIVIVLLFRYTHSQDTNNCGISINVVPGTIYDIKTPNYPNSYTPGTSCLWIGRCPSGYNCKLYCYDVNLPQSTSCSMDRFLISKEGDPQLASADYYCGQGSVTAVSTGQQISAGLISSKYSSGGRVRCDLSAQRATTAPTCTCGIHRANRIVGGVQTDPYEFPMMAGIKYVEQDQIRCGGVIIANNYVLTAAHCLEGRTVRNVSVDVGVYDQGNAPPKQSLAVLSIKIHPGYRASNYDYDMAILQTSTMTFNQYVSPVCLPFKYANVDFTGAVLTLLGFGTTSFGGPVSRVLRKVDVSVISQSSCRSSVPTLTDRQFCAFTRGKDACQDDSGGPSLYTDPQTGLLYNFGIISFGQFCASQSNPGVYTRVNVLLDFITQYAPSNYCRL